MNRVFTPWGIVLIVLVLLVGWGVSSYNSLVAQDQAVQSQWGTVETVYQRRADLIPNLVATVKGVANFEKSTYIAVAQARAKVGQVTVNTGPTAPTDAATLAQFDQAQSGLTSALSRLLAVVENYPDLKANENFLDLQAQLEGTENRISVERRRYNEVVQQFNTTRQSFPTVLIAGMFGERFQTKPYFQAATGAETAPAVHF
jgi:LemA protein